MKDKAKKKVYALYFTPLFSREFSGRSESWRLYYGEEQLNGQREGHVCNAKYSGDLYLSPDIKEISGTYYPVIGPYDIADPDVAEYHVLLAKTAGMDGFFADWHFKDAQTTPGIFNLARTAAKYDFEIGIDWVNIVLFLWKSFKNRTDCIEEAKSDLLYVLQELYSIAGIYRDGRPLMLIFDSHAEDALTLQQRYFSAKELMDIREAMEEKGFHPILLSRTISVLERNRSPVAAEEVDFSVLNGSVDEEMAGAVDGFFPWVNHYGTIVPDGEKIWTSTSSRAYQLACLKEHDSTCEKMKREGRISFYFGGVFPGFDDHKGQAWGMCEMRQIPRDDGAMLRATWEALMESNVDTAFIVTWNDWVEATQVEPSMELGYSEMEICGNYISRWKGTDFNKNLMVLPEEIFHLRKSVRILSASRMSGDKVHPLIMLVDEAALAVSRMEPELAKWKVQHARESCGKLFQSLQRQKIALLWEYGVANHGFETIDVSDSDTAAANGMIGVEWTAQKHELGLCINQEMRDRFHKGCFSGHFSFEFLDQGTGFLRVYVDAADEAGRIIADFHMTGTGEWRRVSMDLVNQRFIKGLDGGFDIMIRQVDQVHGGIRLVRVDGTLYHYEQ